MHKVAVIRTRYLPTSETFVYSELVKLRSVCPIVCAKTLENDKKFPFKPIFLFQTPNELQQILIKQNVSVIHARFGLTGAEILKVKQKLGIPMLTSFHGFDLPTNITSRKRYKGRLQTLFQQGEAFMVTSHNMADILIRYGCPKSKIIVHYSGIDLDTFRHRQRVYPNHGKIIILSVGRLVEKKGMTFLVNAFAKVKDRFPNSELRIVGDGKLRNQLQAQIKKLRLSDNVRLLGALDHQQVAAQMNEAHLFVLASVTSGHGDQEGIPNVLKEAMASGIPVISTHHAGIPEIVTHNQSGYLVPERSVNGLAEKLELLIAQPETWKSMGKQGRKTVARLFNAKKQIKKLEKIYLDLAGDEGGL